jgi:3,4-dihydroxy 2-butanone 4-phosphate synthase/GTP cyclohydrolase II
MLEISDQDLNSPQAVLRATNALAKGGFIIVVDDEDRENEGDLIMAADAVTPEAMAFLIRFTSGIICVPMERARLDALQIGPMVKENTDPLRTAFAVSVDSRRGTSTGVSAKDRALTISALARDDAKPEDFARPGHIFPLEYRPGGVLVRAGHTEAAIDFARLAHRKPIGVLAELVNDDGTMKRLQELRSFASEHRIPIVSIEGLISYRRRYEQLVVRVAESLSTTKWGEFKLVQYQCKFDGSFALAIVNGAVNSGGVTVVRVQLGAGVADTFGLRTPGRTSNSLEAAMKIISESASAVLVYIPRHAPIDLSRVLVGEQLPDTPPAPTCIDLRGRWRDTGIGCQILADLGVTRIRLVDDSQWDYAGLDAYHITVVERMHLP